MQNLSFEWVMEYFQDEKSKRDYEPQLLFGWEKFANAQYSSRHDYCPQVKADVANLAFENQKSNTIEDLSVSASALIQMARSNTDGSNTYDSLKKSAQIFYNMNEILLETAPACASKVIRKITQQMLDSIGYISEMINTDLTHPLKLDIETGKREFWQDYDGALPKDPSDIKYLEEMNQNDADLAATDVVIRQKVKNLQANMSSTLRTVKNMLLDDMAVGEESSHILRRESGVELYTRVDLGSKIFVDNYTTVNNEFYNFTAPPFFGLEVDKIEPYSRTAIAFTNIYFNNTMFKNADTKSRLNTGSLDVELTFKETKVKIPISNAKDFFEISVGVQNKTLQSAKAEVTVPSNNSSNVILEKTKLGNYTGVLYVGIAQPINNYSIPNLVIGNVTFALNLTTDYVLDILESNCYFFDENAGIWSTRGCQPGSKSSREISHCVCNHLTTFASGIFVSPNSIDFEFVFTHLDFDKNVTIYVTITVIMTIYAILIFYTKSADDKDLRKLGLTPLADNNPNDRYFYEILVSTGMSRDSATDSKVQIILYGENEQTSIRTLEDSERPIFRNGQTNRFLLGVPRSLGFVHSIRIWHDNSGEDMLASWFLNYVVVFDLHTHEKFPFVVNRWLAVEEDDGEVERCVVVSSEKDIKNFGTLFGAHSKRKLIDDHIWASIFLRPSNSRFSRTERLTCCLVFLFSTMLTSAMWYGAMEYASKSDYWDLYWMKISKEELGVAIMSNIVVFPINFLIAFLFRFSSDRKSLSLIKAQDDDTSKSTSINDFESRSINDTFDEEAENQDRRPIFRQIKFDKQELDDDVSGKIIKREERRQKKKKSFVLPAFCKNLAWLLCLITVTSSIFFLLSYAIQMGDQKTQKWLAALMLSFFTSVFFVQPLKIVIVVVLLSWIFKEDFTDEVDEEQLFVKLKDDTEYKYLHNTAETTLSYDRRIFLTPHDKELYRTRRKHDLKMYDSMREIVAYGVFLIFVLIIVHHNYDQSLYRRHLGTLFCEQDAHPRSMKK
uniref:Uncharacterized protein n=1 Tax=Romanomermis culicivorax TaxID=13658 RepID=A0A915J789_ROMCU